MAPNIPFDPSSNNAETLHYTRNPQFSDLPAEIKLCIGEHIPPVSASYFSLCSRTLEQILGPQSWSSLQHAGYEYRMEYVLILARDLPADFACHGCVRWHRAWSVQWPLALSANQPMPFVGIAQAYWVEIFSHCLLKFEHIQLVLKNYQHGLAHGIPSDALTHTEYHIREQRGATSLLAAEARIDSGEVLMRSQPWIFYREIGGTDSFYGGSLDSLCQHIWMLRSGPSGRDWQCCFSQPDRYTLQHWAVAVGTIQKYFEAQPR
jgi:hypothetical protein